MLCRTVFITGTDTGVGKTVVTGLLLSHLRESGVQALAIKPFCTGDRADAEILHAVQGGELEIEEINPFYFPEPIAPLVAARKCRRRIQLREVLEHITHLQKTLAGRSTLLIEGAGGLLAPLGEGYTALEIVAKLRCEVVVVGANRLGTINHALLTVRALQALGLGRIGVVVSDVFPTSGTKKRIPRKPWEHWTPEPRSIKGPPTPASIGFRRGKQALSPSEGERENRGQRQCEGRFMGSDSALVDVSTSSNTALLRELLAPLSVHQLPYLGQGVLELGAIKRAARSLEPVLERILREER